MSNFVVFGELLEVFIILCNYFLMNNCEYMFSIQYINMEGSAPLMGAFNVIAVTIIIIVAQIMVMPLWTYFSPYIVVYLYVTSLYIIIMYYNFFFQPRQEDEDEGSVAFTYV